MREAMASAAGPADPARTCKRVAVVVWALAHVTVTLYVLRVLFDGSQGSTTMSDCLRGLNPYKSQRRGELTEEQLAYRKAADEFRRQSAPLLLILRVKEIEAEVALKSHLQAQVPAKAEEEERLVTLETGPQGVRPIEDDAAGAAQRSLLPPDKCQPEPNTDFGGVAVRWGLTFHVDSAAECCKACSKQASYARRGQRKCNVWVFCPHRDGCPSPDGYEHKFGECWLKQADKPRAVVRDYSAFMRDKSVPVLPVLWISGVIPANE